MKKLPYTHTDVKLNRKITRLMHDFDKFVKKSKKIWFRHSPL